MSYLDIVSVLNQKESKPMEDKKELWKRIVFSIAVSNTDDHLRNHGFLFDSKGLRLSTMYDVNPNPNSSCLSLSIDGLDNSLDYDIAIDAAPYFGIKKDEGASIIKEMKDKVSLFRYVAGKYEVSQSEINRMESAFNI